MSQMLGEYVSLLKKATRLEGIIDVQLDRIHEAMTRLAEWKADGCWELNVHQIGWRDVPSCGKVLELIQNWRDAQSQLATLEAKLSDDERHEILAPCHS